MAVGVRREREGKGRVAEQRADGEMPCKRFLKVFLKDAQDESAGGFMPTQERRAARLCYLSCVSLWTREGHCWKS